MDLSFIVDQPAIRDRSPGWFGASYLSFAEGCGKDGDPLVTVTGADE
jgi:hypothetical protein